MSAFIYCTNSWTRPALESYWCYWLGVFEIKIQFFSWMCAREFGLFFSCLYAIFTWFANTFSGAGWNWCGRRLAGLFHWETFFCNFKYLHLRTSYSSFWTINSCQLLPKVKLRGRTLRPLAVQTLMNWRRDWQPSEILESCSSLKLVVLLLDQPKCLFFSLYCGTCVNSSSLESFLGHNFSRLICDNDQVPNFLSLFAYN